MFGRVCCNRRFSEKVSSGAQVVADVGIFGAVLHLLTPVSFRVTIRFLVLAGRFNRVVSVRPRTLLNGQFTVERARRIVTILPLQPWVTSSIRTHSEGWVNSSSMVCQSATRRRFVRPLPSQASVLFSVLFQRVPGRSSGGAIVANRVLQVQCQEFG